MSDEIIIRDELEKIRELQKVDSGIFDLKLKLGSFPARLSEMDNSLENKRGGMSSAEEDLKNLQVLKNSRETDMQAKEEKIKKHEGELYQIKNNKEYQALQQEINSIKADVSLIEEDLIGLFDRIEEAQSRFEEEKKKFEQERASVEQEKAGIRKEEQELKSDLSEYAARRTEIAGTVAAEVLSQYQRILDKWGRVAVANVDGDFCGECNMQLRPQIVNEARLKKNLVLCEMCTRILYAEE